MIRSSLILAFALFAPLAAHAQSHYLGTGRAMLPALTHNERLAIYEGEMIDVHVGDLVARQLGVYLIGTRAIRCTATGWITGADSASADDAGLMTERSYLGKVYPDLSRADGRAPNGPIVHNIYVLTPYRPVIYAHEVGDYVPPRVDPDPKAHSVPDGGMTSIMLVISLLGIITLPRCIRA